MKQLKYLTNGLNMWELTQRFLEMAKIFVKSLKYMGHGLSVSNDLNILNMASMRGKRLKYLRNHFTMLEMT